MNCWLLKLTSVHNSISNERRKKEERKMANKLVSNLILFPFLFFNVEFNNNWKFILNKETESGFLLNINTNTKMLNRNEIKEHMQCFIVILLHLCLRLARKYPWKRNNIKYLCKSRCHFYLMCYISHIFWYIIH